MSHTPLWMVQVIASFSRKLAQLKIHNDWTFWIYSWADLQRLREKMYFYVISILFFIIQVYWNFHNLNAPYDLLSSSYKNLFNSLKHNTVSNYMLNNSYFVIYKFKKKHLSVHLIYYVSNVSTWLFAFRKSDFYLLFSFPSD